MKKIILIVLTCCLLFAFKAESQTYNPALHTVSNKAYGMAQAGPTDARSWYFDQSLFIYRPYQSTTEVNTYLNLAKYRTGHFSIFVNVGGTLNLDGSFTGGVFTEYWYKAGTTNGDLITKSLTGVMMYTDSASMLIPYMRKGDTAAMLLPYLRKSDTASMLAPYTRDGDTALMLSKYLRKSDTLNFGTKSWAAVLDVGNVTHKLIRFDSLYAIPGGTTNIQKDWLRWKPLYQDGSADFSIAGSSQSYTGVTTKNQQRLSLGYNYTGSDVGGTGRYSTLEPSIAIVFDPYLKTSMGVPYTSQFYLNYINQAGTLRNLEEFSVDSANTNFYHHVIANNDRILRADGSILSNISDGQLQFFKGSDNWRITGDATGVTIVGNNIGNYGPSFVASNFTSFRSPKTILLTVPAHEYITAILAQDSTGLQTWRQQYDASGLHIFTNSGTASPKPLFLEPDGTLTTGVYNDKFNIATPLQVIDDPAGTLQPYRLFVANTTLSATSRIQNSFSSGTTYALQVLSLGSTSGESNTLYIQPFNNSGVSNNKGIRVPSSLLAGASNWMLYSQSAAWSYMEGWLGIGPNNTTPLAALDVKGQFKLDTLNSSALTDSVVMWDATSKKFRKLNRSNFGIALDTTNLLYSKHDLDSIFAIANDLVFFGIGSGIHQVYTSGGGDTVYEKNLNGPYVKQQADSSIKFASASDQTSHTIGAENSATAIAISDTLHFSADDTLSVIRISVTAEVYGGASHASNFDKLRLAVRDGATTVSPVVFQHNSTLITAGAVVTLTYRAQWNSASRKWIYVTQANGFATASSTNLASYNDYGDLTSENLIGTDNTAWLTFEQNVATPAKGMRVINWTIEHLHK